MKALKETTSRTRQREFTRSMGAQQSRTFSIFGWEITLTRRPAPRRRSEIPVISAYGTPLAAKGGAR